MSRVELVDQTFHDGQQLAQYDMTERLNEVLEETVRGREEMGHPISATPFSQLVTRCWAPSTDAGSPAGSARSRH